MKKFTLLCCTLLSLLPQLLHSQEILLQKQFPEAYLEDVIIADDGYYVLGHQNWKTQRGHVIDNFHDGFLVKLDGNFNEIWRYTFPSGDYPSFKSILKMDNGILVSSTNYKKTANGQAGAWLIMISEHGDFVWDKVLQYPGFHSTEGKWMKMLPDGNALVMTEIYRNYNSHGDIWMHKVSSQGEVIWSQRYGTEHYYCYLSNAMISAKGTVVLTGSAYENHDWFMKENSSGWMLEINPQDPSRPIRNKTFRQIHNLHLKDVIELDNGNHWIIANTSKQTDTRGSLHGSTLIMMDKDWNIIRSQKFWDTDHMMFNALCWNAASERIILMGAAKTSSSLKRREGRRVELNVDWEVMKDETRKGTFYKDAKAFSNGEILALTLDGVEIIR